MEKLTHKPVNFSWLDNNHNFRWNEPTEWYGTIKWLPSAMKADIDDATDCHVARNKKTGQLVIEETILRYDDIIDPNGMEYSDRRYLDVTLPQSTLSLTRYAGMGRPSGISVRSSFTDLRSTQLIERFTFFRLSAA